MDSHGGYGLKQMVLYHLNQPHTIRGLSFHILAIAEFKALSLQSIHQSIILIFNKI